MNFTKKLKPTENLNAILWRPTIFVLKKPLLTLGLISLHEILAAGPPQQSAPHFARSFSELEHCPNSPLQHTSSYSP